MKRSKATFKALREQLGMTQIQLAKALDVKPLTVKRWEIEGKTKPPQKAWSILDRYKQIQEQAVQDLWEELKIGRRPQHAIELRYLRNDDEFDEVKDEDTEMLLGYTMFNANVFAIAQRLELGGFRVCFDYLD